MECQQNSSLTASKNSTGTRRIVESPTTLGGELQQDDFAIVPVSAADHVVAKVMEWIAQVPRKSFSNTKWIGRAIRVGIIFSKNAPIVIAKKGPRNPMQAIIPLNLAAVARDHFVERLFNCFGVSQFSRRNLIRDASTENEHGNDLANFR